jgi:hypothetical protein
METSFPSSRERVLFRSIAGSEVYHGYLPLLLGIVCWPVDQGTLLGRGGMANHSIGENTGEGDAEGRDRVFKEFMFEWPLIKDVAFSRLHHDEDAGR